jgi:hypothetical protein
MSATLGVAALPRGLFAELDRRQPVLARLGWASLALLALCLAAMAVDGRSFNGVSVWAKPAKFAASFVPWFWTMAWAWGALSAEAARGRTARLILWATVAAAGFEQFWITWRAAIGGPSHFAADPLGTLMYSLMGLGAVTLVAMARCSACWCCCGRHRASPAPGCWRSGSA